MVDRFYEAYMKCSNSNELHRLYEKLVADGVEEICVFRKYDSTYGIGEDIPFEKISNAVEYAASIWNELSEEARDRYLREISMFAVGKTTIIHDKGRYIINSAMQNTYWDAKNRKA